MVVDPSNQQNLLTGPVAPLLRTMTIPMCYAVVAMNSYFLVDTFFVGLLGTTQLAALGFCVPVAMIVGAIGVGLGIGTSANVARSIGAGKHHEAARISTHSLLLTFLVVVLISAVGVLSIGSLFTAMGAPSDVMPFIRDYMLIWYLAVVLFVVPQVGNAAMRATGDTFTPSRIMIGGALVNVALDPIFIFGFGPIPGYGLQGAALATALSWSFVFAASFYVLRFRKRLIEYRLGGLASLLESWRHHLRISAPAIMANMFTPIALSMLTAIIASYGPQAVAAYGVGQRIEHLAILVVLALSTSLPPFISQNLGGDRLERVAEALHKVIRFVLIWQMVVYVSLVLCAPFIARMFTSDPEVARVIRLFLYILPLSYGLQGVAILSNSSFNALHEPKFAVLLSVVRSFMCYVPLAYIGSVLDGVAGLFAGAALGNVLSGTLGGVWVSRYIANHLR